MPEPLDSFSARFSCFGSDNATRFEILGPGVCSGMSQIAYTVTATLPDNATCSEYIAWLFDGHVDAVLAGGAICANVVRIDRPAEPIRVQTCYVFPSQEALDAYTQDHAPSLRANGLARFGPDRNVSFERTIGVILEP